MRPSHIVATFYNNGKTYSENCELANEWIADAVERGIYSPEGEGLEEQVEVHAFYKGVCVVEFYQD